MRLAKTAIARFSMTVLISVLGFVTTWFIARELGAGPLGTYSSLLAVVFWLHIPSTAFDAAIKKRVSEGVDRGAFLTGGIALNVAYALLVVTVLLLLHEQFAAIVGIDLGVWVVVLLVGYSTVNTVSNSLTGAKRVATAGAVLTFDRATRSVLQIGLIVVGYELGGLVLGHAVGLVVATAIGAVLVLRTVSPSLPARSHFQQLLAYSRYSWVSTIQARAFGSMDILVLTVFVASDFVGVYKVAWTVASFLAVVSGAVSETLFPNLSELDATGKRDEIPPLVEEALVYVGIFAIPGLFGAAVLGERVLRIYGPEFGKGAIVLTILVLARLVDVYSGQFRNTINAVDRPDLTFRITIAFLVANLVLNVGLVAAFGWIGAAVATTTSAALSLVLSYYALQALLPAVRLPAVTVGKEVFAGASMAGVVFTIQPLVPTTHWATIGLVGVGAATYFAVLLAISGRVRTTLLGLLPASIR